MLREYRAGINQGRMGILNIEKFKKRLPNAHFKNKINIIAF